MIKNISRNNIQLLEKCYSTGTYQMSSYRFGSKSLCPSNVYYSNVMKNAIRNLLNDTFCKCLSVHYLQLRLSCCFMELL